MYRSDRIIIRYFPRFRNRFFPGSDFSSSYRRTFYQVFRIFIKSGNLKNQGFREPHMTKVTYFSTVLNGKTGYRRIRLKLRTAQLCASSMPGTAGFHITGSPPDICLCLCSFQTSILILKDEQVSINA